MDLAQRLVKLAQIKAGLKSALNDKGAEITDETLFEDYVDAVENLSTGGMIVDRVSVTDRVVDYVTGTLRDKVTVSDPAEE